jgi:hypothetical protein
MTSSASSPDDFIIPLMSFSDIVMSPVWVISLKVLPQGHGANSSQQAIEDLTLG